MKQRRLQVLAAATLCLMVSGCENGETSSPDEMSARADGTAQPAETAGAFDLVAHAELKALRASPAWSSSSSGLNVGGFQGDLTTCADLLAKADALTLGANEEGFELYVEGPMDPDQAEACAQTLREEVGQKGDEKVEALHLDERLLAITTPDVEPSPERLAMLVGQAPGGAAGRDLWIVGQNLDDDDGDDAEGGAVGLDGWMDVSDGLDAQFRVDFSDGDTARQTAGDVGTAMAAISLVPEAKELVKGVEVRAEDRALFAEVHLTAKQLEALEALEGGDGEHGSVSIGIGAGSAPPEGSSGKSGLVVEIKAEHGDGE